MLKCYSKHSVFFKDFMSCIDFMSCMDLSSHQLEVSFTLMDFLYENAYLSMQFRPSSTIKRLKKLLRLKEFLLWMMGENSLIWVGPEKDSVEHI